MDLNTKDVLLAAIALIGTVAGYMIGVRRGRNGGK